MNDPHVEELHYRVQHGDQVDYAKAPPFEREEKDFKSTWQTGMCKLR